MLTRMCGIARQDTGMNYIAGNLLVDPIEEKTHELFEMVW